MDGRPACAEDVLKPGAVLSWRRPPWDEPDVPLAWSVIYEDEDLLAVSKPCGLPTVPAGGFLEHTLFTLVRREYPETTPIHRLGRGTSGIVLFARTGRARSGLCAALRGNEIERTYRALASGVPASDRFEIDAPIGLVPHEKLGKIHAACDAGKRALSRVRVIERMPEESLLEVSIDTGRPHQIRIHLAWAGFPLRGDPLYGPGGGIRDHRALPGDPGYLLHAEKLAFAHPKTGLRLELVCPPPLELLPGRGRG